MPFHRLVALSDSWFWFILSNETMTQTGLWGTLRIKREGGTERMTSSLCFPQGSQTAKDGKLQKQFACWPLLLKSGFQGQDREFPSLEKG